MPVLITLLGLLLAANLGASIIAYRKFASGWRGLAALVWLVLAGATASTFVVALLLAWLVSISSGGVGSPASND